MSFNFSPIWWFLLKPSYWNEVLHLSIDYTTGARLRPDRDRIVQSEWTICEPFKPKSANTINQFVH